MSIGLSGHEKILGDSELIVSKTDLKGRITYANRTFFRFAGYSPEQIKLAPHNIVRHPHMPRSVFKFLWDNLAQGGEVFAYVINRSANGDHYWVFAHVTPSRDNHGQIVGYHSNRRSVNRRVVDQVIAPLYAQMVEAENQYGDTKAAMAFSLKILTDILAASGKSYNEFILSL